MVTTENLIVSVTGHADSYSTALLKIIVHLNVSTELLPKDSRAPSSLRSAPSEASFLDYSLEMPQGLNSSSVVPVGLTHIIVGCLPSQHHFTMNHAPTLP